MQTTVKREDVKYTCTSEEQLELFLKAGYEVVKDEPEKKTGRKASK